MPLFEAVRMALRTIVTQKLKSFFSLIGVLIGVTFLIAVVSIVQGMNVYMEDQFANRLIGLNTFTLRRMPGINTGNVTDDMWRDWHAPAPHQLRRRGLRRRTLEDARYLRPVLLRPDGAHLRQQAGQGHRADGNRARPTSTSRTSSIAPGRIFTPQEVRVGVPVLVIGDLLAEKLFEA